MRRACERWLPQIRAYPLHQRHTVSQACSAIRVDTRFARRSIKHIFMGSGETYFSTSDIAGRWHSYIIYGP